MTYQITGISPAAIPSDAIAADGLVKKVVASSKPGFPCRITLEDAEIGEELLLFHHISHDVATPYRSSYAVYARTGVREPARFTDTVPPIFEGRPLAMRGFDAQGMLMGAALAGPGESDATIRLLLQGDDIAYLDVHNAAHGCFAARVERHES